MGSQTGPGGIPNLDAIVNEVAVEAHLRPEELRPEERAYLKEHALKKPLRVLDIWALGVGVVIAGAYFGWNFGLKDNGPIAMLIASLIVCLLYLLWVFASIEEVIYIWSETREGHVATEFLENFKGVLVSDFYSAYDSLDCPQQKCLVHLISLSG